MELANYLRDVPDFPKPGIVFKDISPLLADAEAFAQCLRALAAPLIGHQLDAVVGVESRGFIFGAALARELGCGFVPVRKPGKLPARVRRRSYLLEYGSDSLEIHEDALSQKGAKVAVIDDVLATGGTFEAAIGLCQDVGATVCAAACVIELGFLGGRQRLAPSGVTIHSLITF